LDVDEDVCDGEPEEWAWPLTLVLEELFALELDELFVCAMEERPRPSKDDSDDPDFPRMTMYARADSELRKL
jgi:hypothetical protein